MKPIHLDNFENEISDRILERGYEYYLDGRVVQEHSDKELLESMHIDKDSRPRKIAKKCKTF